MLQLKIPFLLSTHPGEHLVEQAFYPGADFALMQWLDVGEMVPLHLAL